MGSNPTSSISYVCVLSMLPSLSESQFPYLYRKVNDNIKQLDEQDYTCEVQPQCLPYVFDTQTLLLV